MRTSVRTVSSVGVSLLLLMFLATDVSVTGREGTAPGEHVGISLAPSVVTLAGEPGQAHRQTLRLTNHTTRELAFRLAAQDVVAHDGRRAFIAAGELSGSIAATAVFSPREIVIPPGAVGVADITVTVPAGTAVRGVAAIFRGHTVVGSQNGVAMTASLGALITFRLSNDVRLDAGPPEVSPQTATDNLSISEWVSNAGSEPVVASGAAALLNEAGVLVGKVPVEPQRLMPGERLSFKAEYPSLLQPGRYRALLSLEYDANERKVLTRTAEFVVSSADDDDRDPARGADLRR